MSVDPSFSTQLTLQVDAYIGAAKDTKALVEAFEKHRELIQSTGDWKETLKENRQFREDVACAIKFTPDEFDTILAMLEGLPERGLLRKIPGVTDLRSQLVDRLSVDLTTPLALRPILNSFLEARTEDNWQLFVTAVRESIRGNPDLAVLICGTLDWPLPFSLVLWQEIKQVELSRLHRRTSRMIPDTHLPYQRAVRNELIGLAFSGGGIRSATFNLGVLQGLAGLKLNERSLLERFDYISTVSGGGYIGSWLATWANRETFSDVAHYLAQAETEDPDYPSTRPVSFLRRFSNYLTPKLGLFSPDSWTLAAVYLRNVTLNLIVLIGVIAAILLLPRLLAWHSFGGTKTAVAAATLLLLAVGFITINLDDVTSETSTSSWSTTNKGIHFLVVVPVLISAFLWSTWFSLRDSTEPFKKLSVGEPWTWMFGIFFVLTFVLQWAGGFRKCFVDRHMKRRTVKVWIAMLLIAGACSLVGVLLMRGYVEVLSRIRSLGEQGEWHTLIWGPVLLLIVVSLMLVFQVGLMGLDFRDSDREWLSRLRAVTNIYTVFWLALFSAAIYGPLLFVYASNLASGLTVGWLVTTIVSVLAGNNISTGVNEDGKPKRSKLDLIAQIGPPVFMVGFVLIISFGIHLLLAYGRPSDDGSTVRLYEVLDPHWNHLLFWHYSHWWSDIAPLFVLLVLVTIVLSRRIDINEFSMHHFYKNRLVRCYLGASRLDVRTPNEFTGFDENDDLPLKDLNPGNGYFGPYPIINATLNLTTGEQLAWQERKASSFVFTPRYCGFEVKGNGNLALEERSIAPYDTWIRPFGFRETQNYGYPRTGIHIGTAAAISGAAVSPNQGFHTSTAVAFLLTVFDVRLGWWLGNPRLDIESKSSSPGFGLMYLVKELLGLTDDNAGYVSLSDGGHFENLGIYELVRRRCKYIVACDAEQDAGLTFNGLGNAVRKCRTDFGVEIDIQPQRIARSKKTNHSLTHCVVGTIRYPDSSVGMLIYLKSSLVGDEPEDVLEYASAHSEFPHQTTADQWFDESQFESYRKLGQHVARTTFKPAIDLLSSLALPESEFFAQVWRQWYPPSKAIARHATKHTQTYMRLLEILRANALLKFLDLELFPTSGLVPPAGPPGPDQMREAFYFCISLIQLLEDIYMDFNLGLESQRKHPHVGGWISLYRDWVKTPTMLTTWNGISSTYNEHFKAFWKELSN
jgi:hypothetical protein